MSHLAHRRLRAPEDDGAALIEPSGAETTALISKNQAIAIRFQQTSGFTPVLFNQARQLLLDPPRIFIQPKNDIDTRSPIVATGHQPELFHPGVWFKNFLAAAIARHVSGSTLNLVVDNDLVHRSAIRVPTRVSAGLSAVDVPFNEPPDHTTWEWWTDIERETFRQFPEKVRRVIKPLMTHNDYQRGMILDRFWPAAIESFETQDEEFREFSAGLSALANEPQPDYPPFGLLRDCFSAARRQLESEIGLTLLDSPISEIAEQRPFHEFLRILFVRHRELHEIHNAALHEYRAVNHLRSESHPVPELANHEPWVEMPLWLSTFENQRRRPVFVRASNDNFELTDRGQTSVSLPKKDSADYRPILMREHIRLRPRALITTMYARLVLSDLFIHGIGGAKYDELTDLIIRRFFRIEPPAYITATATFRLPIDRPQVSLDDVRQSAQHIRELRYRPESFLRDERVRRDTDLAAKLDALAAEKREYLAAHDLRRCSQDAFDHLDRLNRAMHDLLKPVEEEARARHVELIALAKQSQLLSSREFSFVLFPAEKLPAQLLALSKAVA